MFRRAEKIEDSKKSYEEAAQIFMDMNKLATAAKVEKEIGEMLEEKEEFAEAIPHLKRAADYFEAESQKTTANGCLLKVAHMNAALENYDDAIEQFEKSIELAVDDKMLKFQAKEYIFKACICKLASISDGDLDEFKNKHQDYKDQDVHYPDSFEARLIDGVVEAFEKGDIKTFQSSMRDFDRIKKLDPWKTDLFLKIKKNIEKRTQPDLTGEIDLT
jgi:alpha-soluble NSF attachment protein